MKVCFSIGSNSAGVIERVQKSLDSVEFFSYDSVSSLIKESTLRRIYFDRIVFSGKILESYSEDLLNLYNYLADYSPDTTVVLIISKEGNELSRLFSDLFNSPLYTSVVANSVSISIVEDFVTSDILTLKHRYGGLDIPGVKEEVPKEVQAPVVPEKEPKKKGLLKGLFSSNKKAGADLGAVESAVEGASAVGNAINSVGNNGLETTVAGVALDTVKAGASVASELPLNNEREGNSFSKKTAPGFGEYDYLDDDNSSDGDGLSISDFGESHEDTGFFDDEDEEEVLRDLNKDAGSFQNEEDSQENDDYAYEEEENEYIPAAVDLDYDLGYSGAKLLIGERGVGVTSYIANYSIQLTEVGKKVLIVDLDYKKNGILSFIDTGAYMKVGQNGISKMRPFYEDGISVMSNGYGWSVSAEDVNVLISNLPTRYDVILFDCPLDCIDLLGTRILNKCDTQIMVAGNRGSVMSTVEGLTDRGVLKPDIEDCLYNSSNFVVVKKIDEYDEDLVFLSESLIFSRNNWLDKLN